MLKKILLTLAGATAMLIPASVLAATNPLDGACSTVKNGSSSICNQAGSIDSNTQNPIATTLHTVANILAIIAAVIAIIMIIIAGLTMVTSQGNSEAVSTSRNRIIYSVVGLIIIAMAWSITNLIANHLG